MNILAIDTTGSACSAAVARDDNLICEQYLNHGLTHSAMLMPIIDGCLSLCGMEIGQIDLFAVAVGPGSFTGLRIGVNTVKAFAQALEKPVAGISTLDALQANIAGFAGAVCPIINAGRGQVYAAVYENGEKILEDKPMDIDGLMEYLQDKKSTLFLGDGVLALREQIADKLPSAVFAPGNLLFQRAGGVCRQAFKAYQRNELFTAWQVKPNYLRKTQAERLKRGN